MKVLLVIFAAVFFVSFSGAPTMGAGWFWDAGNALGFSAFAGLLYLTVTSGRRIDVHAHQIFGFGVLFVAALHAFWFLLGDATVSEFLKIGAPDYMWHGVVSILLLGILITIALVPDRIRLHRDYSAFKYWHRIAAITTIGTAAYHIVVSQFYITYWYQAALFVMLTIVVAFGRNYWLKLGQLPIVGNGAYLGVTILFAVAFAAIRNIPA